MTSPNPKKPGSASTRGFASMDVEKRRAIASKGGQSVPNRKKELQPEPRLGRRSWPKGGRNVSHESRSFSRNRDLR